MKSQMIKLLVAGLMLVFTSTTQAGFLIEPYINQTLSGEAEQSGTTPVDADASHLLYGARLGYMSAMGFMVGGDIQLGTGEWEFSNGSNDTSYQDLGIFLGYQTMMGFRAYFSYLFQAKVTVDYTTETEYDGSGFKLGLGYSFMNYGAPWFAINVEYHTTTYTDFEQGISSGSLSDDIDANAILIGISIPIDLAMM